MEQPTSIDQQPTVTTPVPDLTPQPSLPATPELPSRERSPLEWLAWTVLFSIIVAVVIFGYFQLQRYLKVQETLRQQAMFRQSYMQNRQTQATVSPSPVAVVDINEDHGGLSFYPVYKGNYTVADLEPPIACLDGSGSCSEPIDIYLKDPAGKKFLFSTVKDLDWSSPVYRGGYVFYKKKFLTVTSATDILPNDELWIASDKDHSQKVFDMQDFDFSVSPEGGTVALSYDDPSSGKPTLQLLHPGYLIFSDPIHLDASACPLEGGGAGPFFFGGLQWKKSGEAWNAYGSVDTFADRSSCFWEVRNQDETITYWPSDPQEYVGVNPENGYAVYVDKEYAKGYFHMYEPEWNKAHPSYQVYLYSITNKTKQVIDTLPSDFNFYYYANKVKWLSSTQVQYNSPSGIKTYTIK